MKAKYALVLLWTGRELTDEEVKSIHDFIIDRNVSIPELVTTAQLDEASIAKNIAKSFVQEIGINDVVSIQHACNYIGGAFKDALRDNKGNYWRFASELQTAVNKMIVNPAADRALANAIKIIVNADSIPQSLVRKNHIGTTALEIIRYIYNQYSGLFV